jgi:Tol biopolymer transport system component
MRNAGWLVLVAAGVVAAAGTGSAAPGDERIVFVTDRDAPNVSEEIYVMNPDGSDPVRLTNNTSNDNGPVWSHNRKRIAFHSGRAGLGYPQVYVMKADGTDQGLLADLGPRGAMFPSWTREANTVCFQTQLRPRDVFVVRGFGGEPANLTNHAADDFRCDYSPLGDRMAFVSNRDGNDEIYVMNADGSEVVRLTTTAAAENLPDWSPDGSRIVFESSRDGNPEIYVMNSDGTEQTRLTFFTGQDSKPSWSPDGTRITWHRRLLGHGQIMTMFADGSGATQITFTPDPAFSGFPSWGTGNAPSEDEEF